VVSLLFDLLVIMLGELNQHGLTRVCIVGEAASSLSAWFLWLTVDMKQTLIFTTATDVKAYFMTPTKFFIYPCIDRAMVLLSVTMVCWNPQSIQTK
jgi:hypothetical protein